MPPDRRNSGTIFISFSGIDGAGKSTQIDALSNRMKEDGRRVRLVRFWDDIAQLTRIRETAGHSIFRGDKGVGTPSAPINRRDKNVRSWLMTGMRLFLYFIDAIALRIAVGNASQTDADLVIFDRYIYDELANLTLHNQAIRAYVLLIMKFVPKPHISYFLDADPVKARARKPEYPLEFLQANRQSYLALNDLIRGMTVIAQMPVQDVERVVLKHALDKLSIKTPSRESDNGVAAEDYEDKSANVDRRQTGPAAS